MCNSVITLFINDTQIEIFQGATLKHALLRANELYYKQVIEKKMEIRDQEGNLVGVNGAVENGCAYYVYKINNEST